MSKKGGSNHYVRMRANKLVMQRIERLASEMIGIVTSLPTQKAQTVVELQQAFGKQLTDTRNAIGKELNVIRTSYAAIFHGFVAHADYYHTPGPSNGKVDWKTIAGLRPIAALAKLMKMEQAMADAKRKQQMQPQVPDVEQAMGSTPGPVIELAPTKSAEPPIHKPALMMRDEQRREKAAAEGIKLINDVPAAPVVIADKPGEVEAIKEIGREAIDAPSFKHACIICGALFISGNANAKVCRKCAEEALAIPMTINTQQPAKV